MTVGSVSSSPNVNVNGVDNAVFESRVSVPVTVSSGIVTVTVLSVEPLSRLKV